MDQMTQQGTVSLHPPPNSLLLRLGCYAVGSDREDSAGSRDVGSCGGGCGGSMDF